MQYVMTIDILWPFLVLDDEGLLLLSKRGQIGDRALPHLACRHVRLQNVLDHRHLRVADARFGSTCIRTGKRV